MKNDRQLNNDMTKTGHSVSAKYQRVIRQLAKAVARLVRLVDKPSMDFVKAYKAGIIECLLEENPRMHISELSIRSGIDRRQISVFLRDKKLSEKEKRNKVLMVLSELGRITESHYPDRKIPRNGREPSFDSICKKYANGDYSPGAILKELKRKGNVVDHGSTVELVSTKLKHDTNEIELLGFVATTVDRFSQTTVYNQRHERPEERLLQRSVTSTRIPIECQQQVIQELKRVLERAHDDCLKIIESKESNVSVGTFEPIGVSLFQFAPLPAQTDSRHWGEEY